MTAACYTGLAPAASAQQASFYDYSGSAALSSVDPGTVLASRTFPYHVTGLPVPITTVQLLYRTTDAQGAPTTNVTSVLKPPGGVDPTRAVAYQSFYDSLNPADGPSRDIAGQPSGKGTVNTIESRFIVGMLAQGYTVIVADTEGRNADFAAGPEYGMATLDSVRAATRSPAVGLNSRTRVGLFGYSGGAIATAWAAALAAGYAPDVDRELVGAAEGGLLVNPVHNLSYVNGSRMWSGVAAMAITGVARSYGIDFAPYLSDYGKQILSKMQTASITEVMGHYPGLTWQQMAKPQYADPADVPPLMEAVRKIDLGLAPTPTVPMFIGQGADGAVEGTPNDKPGIGPGDGVMIAGDVRELARRYCATGDPHIQYAQYDLLSHSSAMAAWLPAAWLWLSDRFAGRPAPANCGQIAPGNPLTPQP
ncbi:triacylglycerol lipase [Rhodococcus sp. D2-41]|nr:triacylglycerol lipase [Rhodococcus sp. D2-41]